MEWVSKRQYHILITLKAKIKSRGLHKVFNKGGIPLLVVSSKLPRTKPKCQCI